MLLLFNECAKLVTFDGKLKGNNEELTKAYIEIILFN